MQNVAQSWLVYRLTHSELLLGTAWFCAQVPVFALGPLGGLASDRWSRHRIVVATQVLSMIQALVLAAMTLSGSIVVWHVLALSVALGVINAFDMPARQSLIVQMASKEDLLNAISLNSTTFNMARVVGPGIAGVLVAAVGEGVCFLINGISFLAVIGGLLAMRLPEREDTASLEESPLSHLIDGFRAVYRNRPVRNVLLLMAATTIGSMPVVVLMPFFADAIFHRGAQGLGVLSAAMGSGAVVGVLGLAMRSELAGLARVIFWSALSLGAAFVLFSVSPSFSFSVAVMVLVGFSVFRQLAAANTLIQSLTPDQYRGRTMALYSMTVVGLGPFGSLLSGALGHGLGVRATVLASGVLCAAAAGWFRVWGEGAAHAGE